MKILIVDDSRAMRAYTKGVLRESFECAVLEATSGFEALRLLPRENVDLVITDINMPDINGLELIKFIRKSERHKSLPVLIISTQTSEQTRIKVFELGANGFISKPFEPETLKGEVSRLTELTGLTDADSEKRPSGE